VLSTDAIRVDWGRIETGVSLCKAEIFMAYPTYFEKRLSIGVRPPLHKRIYLSTSLGR
jgi:hypothetical protein